MAEMKFDVPKEIVEGYVKAAVSEALMKNGKTLVEELVKQCLFAKENSYDRETRFDKALTAAINKEVQAALAAWLEDAKPQIRASIDKALKARHGDLIKKVVDGCTVQLGHGFKIHIEGFGHLE